MRRDEMATRLRPLASELMRFARWLAPADADDIVQETLARALRASGEIADETRLRGWLFRIARNVHIDARRAQADRDRFVVLEGGLDDLASVETAPPCPARIERADLERALSVLPEAARAAVLLTDVWEFDHAEVADILGVPLGTVKSRVARARAHLAHILADHHAGRRRA